MSTSLRRRTQWRLWAPSRTSSSRCSTPQASTTPPPAPSTLRPTSTGTEQAWSPHRRSCRNVKIKLLKIVRSESATTPKVLLKDLKSRIASKSNNTKFTSFLENLYKHSEFYFLRKIQSCVLFFKALPCLML